MSTNNPNDGYPSGQAMLEAPNEEFAELRKRLEESLAQEIAQVRSSLMQQLQQITAQKQALEVTNAKLRVVEQRTIRHGNEMKYMNKVVEKHGLSEDKAPLRQQLFNLELKEKKSSEMINEMHETMCSDIARIETEVRTLCDGEKDHNRIEMLSMSAQLEDIKREQGHFTCWARPLLEEFLPLPTEVRDFQDALAHLKTRQDRCEDDVNKIQRLGRILDDKVEVFDDLQRRMEELNANARRVLGSQFATSVRCLSCKEEDPTSPGTLATLSRQRSASPPGSTAVVNQQFEAQVGRRARPQSAGARLEEKREEKAKSEKQQMVFTVPRVRTDFPKQNGFGPVVGIRGVSIFKPKAPAPRKRPQSARACLQSTSKS